MFDVSAVVACDAELEAVVGAPPGAIMLKSIRFLDGHCERFLACSPFAVLGTSTGDGSLQTIALGGEPGHLAPRSDTVLDLGDVFGKDVVDGAPAGLIALVPGYCETLRINGRLRVRDDVATLDVEEAFLHCAKAVLRSELWTTHEAAHATPEPGGDAAVPAVAAFLADAPFVVLVSTDADGHADASPKGDPPGLIRQIDDTTIAIADRPGNRRTDTLHNLMDESRIALLAMQPGSNDVVEIRGTARVCTDGALLESMRLRNRTPKVALLIDLEHREIRNDPALVAADLWNPSRRIADSALPRAATIWADHVRRNTDAGTGAKVARRLVSKTAFAAGVAYDYRTNL
jgi:predicted pyridoxine 5'-phosphate oxidase superfamily flavin-nucleotide-binding protein